MSISYSALRNYGKVTLPSVEGWRGNCGLSILKDPPKSIHTRRIDKVGENMDIVKMIDESGDRVCEAISLYPRGVNPFKAVEMQNYGTAGGQRSCSKNGQAYLAHRVMRDGDFRPIPMDGVQNARLTALSRLPRTAISQSTNIGSVKYSQLINPSCKSLRQVKNECVQGCARPTMVYRIESELTEPFQAKRVKEQDHIRYSTHSGVGFRDVSNIVNKTPNNSINKNLINTAVMSNLGTTNINATDLHRSKVSVEKYTKDRTYYGATSGVSANIDNIPLDSRADNHSKTKEQTHYTVISQVSGPEKNERNFNSLELPRSILQHSVTSKATRNIYTKIDTKQTERTRVIPTYSATSNISSNKIYRNNSSREVKELTQNKPLTTFSTNPSRVGYGSEYSNTSRSKKINPTLSFGSFEGKGTIKTSNRVHYTDGLSHIIDRKPNIQQRAHALRVRG